MPNNETDAMEGPTIQEIADKFSEAGPQIIKDNLAAGVPVFYEDEDGNWVKEYPSGEIEIIEEAD